MSYSVIIETPAYEDLRDIFTYIAQDSPFIATQILEELQARMKSLQDFPERHPVVLEIRDYKIHHLIFKEGFRILYTIEKQEVHILHCFRSERKLSEDLF